MSSPVATLAIISHERPDLRDVAIESALESVARSGGQLPVLVIESSRTVRPPSLEVRLVHQPDEPSCVGKRRRAFELCQTEWVILLDDDCRVLPDAVGSLLAAMTSTDHRRTAAIFVVTEFTGVRTPMFLAALHSDLAAGFADTADTGDIAWGVTTLSAFRRTAALSVDAFRKGHLGVPVGGEDVDACIRLRNAGWRLHGLAEVLALHDTATWSTFGQNLRRSRNYGAAEAELVRLHPQHARLGYENLAVTGLLGLLCARMVTGRAASSWLAALAGWGAAELVDLRTRHQEATMLELAVQTAWSVSYELGRLRTALARRRPLLAVYRFNWEDDRPTGFSVAPPRGVSRRLLRAGLVASACALLLRELRRAG